MPITYKLDGTWLTITDSYGTLDYYYEDGVITCDADGQEFTK